MQLPSPSRSLLRPALGSRGQGALVGLGGIGAAAAAGVAIAVGPWQLLALAAGGAAGALLMLTRARGLLIGVLVIASVNGLPGVDLAVAEQGLRLTDVATIGLIGACLLRLLLDPLPRPPRHLKYVVVWSASLTAWWLISYLRAILGEGVPYLEAGFFGRDFLFFALLLPLLLVTLRSRTDVLQVLAVVAIGAVVYALGHLQVTLTGRPFPLIVHQSGANLVGPFTRIYASMNELVLAVFPISLGVLLSSWSAASRAVAALLAPLMGASFLLQFTRAAYLGLAVAIVVFIAVGLLLSRRGGAARPPRRLALLALVCIGFFAFLPQTEFGDSPVTAVRERLTTGFQEITGAAEGTLGYRETLGREIGRVVGSRWPIGVGFVPPSFRYEATIPAGGIRNPDVGALNAIATMGLLGAVLIYLPVVGTLLVTMRRLLRGAQDDGANGLRMGISLWLIATLATSVTLITLFSPIGLTITALVLALALRLDDPEDAPAPVATAAVTRQTPSRAGRAGAGGATRAPSHRPANR